MKAIPFDNGGVFPTLDDARAYIYGNSTTSPEYHKDRMRALKYLFAKITGARSIIDFGCGDGMYFREFFPLADVDRIVGVDLYPAMIDLAMENLRDYPFEPIVGGTDKLKDIEGEFDLALAIDVIGYLDNKELDLFFTQMSKIVRSGGHLIVMSGNELFDMFALNSGTCSFFQKHFGLDVTELLTEAKSLRPENAVRKNPLSFSAEIKPYGFIEISKTYSQWHRIPPGIGNRIGNDLSKARLEMRDHNFDPNTHLPDAEKWKANFQSSIFASLSERI